MAFQKLKNLFLDKTSILTLLVGLICSCGLTIWSAKYISNKHRNELRNLTHQIATSISIRMSRYENSLIQLRAHLITTRDFDRDNFKTYVENIPLLQYYPGIQGLGYTVKIPDNELSRYIRTVRKEGFPDFKVWPDSPRKTYYSIHYLEPFDWRNKRAFGFDMYTDATRREAMDQARDTTKAVATSIVKLVQETNEDTQPGFLVYLPVYTETQTPVSLEERKNKLKAFIYAPFRAGDLFNFIFKTHPFLNQQAKIEVYDGYETTENNLYFQNSKLLFEKPLAVVNDSITLPLEMLGKIWTIRAQLYLTPGLMIEKLFPYGVALISILISFLVFWIVFSTRKHNRELRLAIATRDEFMSLASHELKTPLTSLSLQAQMIEKSLKNGEKNYDIKKMERFTGMTISQVRRLNKLVDDLLDVSRINSGKYKLQLEKFEFCSLVRDVLERNLPLFTQEGVNPPKIELCSEVIVEWDQLRIEQVMINLLTNALRYGQGNPIFLKVEKRDSTILLSVQDQGIGIEKSHLNQVFNRFQRFVDPNFSAGLGLGLYLSSKIVLAHGGKIWVESEYGKGSTFFIELPIVVPLT